MENANKFLKDFASGISKGVNVAKLGKVVKFYPEVMKADVIPLPSEDNAMIINVPVATVRTSDFLLYYPLKPDDNVVLLFIDNDTDNILLGEDSIETERDHDVSDCICLTYIKIPAGPYSRTNAFKDTFPSAFLSTFFNTFLS